jgi:flavorubredoxin
MGNALIVCASRTGETVRIGNLIAEGIRISGGTAVVKDVADIKSEKDLEGFDALILGSATYHGDMIQGMKTLLFLAEKADLEEKAGGAFGAFGWSGEAPDRIFDTMKHIFNMSMVDGPLRLKSSIMGGGINMAQDYGKQIAAKMETA